MAFMSAINKMKNGDWAGLGADVLSTAAMAIPVPGVGALLSAGIQSGASAIKGEGAGSIIKAGVSDLAGGVIGKGVGKITGAASKAVSKVSSKVGKGVSTGGAGKAAGSVAGQGYVGTLPNLSGSAPALQGNVKVNVISPNAPVLRGANPTPTSAGPGLLNTNNIKVSNNLPGNLGPKPSLRPKSKPTTLAPVPMSRGQQVVSVAKKKTSNAMGQVGLQGILSIASGIAAAKEAGAANEISRQGLLFQKETYEKQKADEEKYKAKMKEDAYTAYTSSSLFGENLTSSSPSNNLLTDSVSGPGIYSILNTGVTTRRSTDLT